jgi:hypothetical protein
MLKKLVKAIIEGFHLIGKGFRQIGDGFRDIHGSIRWPFEKDEKLKELEKQLEINIRYQLALQKDLQKLTDDRLKLYIDAMNAAERGFPHLKEALLKDQESSEKKD